MVLRERPARAETAAPRTQLAIVGADPPPAMRKLGGDAGRDRYRLGPDACDLTFMRLP